MAVPRVPGQRCGRGCQLRPFEDGRCGSPMNNRRLPRMRNQPKYSFNLRIGCQFLQHAIEPSPPIVVFNGATRQIRLMSFISQIVHLGNEQTTSRSCEKRMDCDGKFRWFRPRNRDASPHEGRSITTIVSFGTRTAAIVPPLSYVLRISSALTASRAKTLSFSSSPPTSSVPKRAASISRLPTCQLWVESGYRADSIVRFCPLGVFNYLLERHHAQSRVEASIPDKSETML